MGPIDGRMIKRRPVSPSRHVVLASINTEDDLLVEMNDGESSGGSCKPHADRSLDAGSCRQDCGTKIHWVLSPSELSNGSKSPNGYFTMKGSRLSFAGSEPGNSLHAPICQMTGSISRFRTRDHGSRDSASLRATIRFLPTDGAVSLFQGRRPGCRKKPCPQPRQWNFAYPVGPKRKVMK